MKKILFKGAGSAVPTPFTENGINTEELKKFLKFQIERKIDALIVCGTTGESATMTKDEKIKVINCALEVSNGKSLGVDGLLIVTPYYNKTSQKGLIAHYKAIADNVNTPIILYNVPSRTGMNIEPETCLELSKIDNIVAIEEASRKYLSSC